MRAPKCEYAVNEHEYKIRYYLWDEIYSKWAIFVKTIPLPQGKSKNSSQNVKSWLGRTLSKPLVCYKLDLPLYVASFTL